MVITKTKNNFKLFTELTDGMFIQPFYGYPTMSFLDEIETVCLTGSIPSQNHQNAELTILFPNIISNEEQLAEMESKIHDIEIPEYRSRLV